MFQNQIDEKCSDDPDTSRTYSKHAKYFESVEKWDKAVTCYKHALYWNNRIDSLKISLSRALLNCGDYDEALIYTQHVLDRVNTQYLQGVPKSLNVSTGSNNIDKIIGTPRPDSLPL